jgi:formamidopyrimidine-DNA glycosylase
MPELPEVETVRLALLKIINKAVIKEVKIFRNDLRWDIKDNLSVILEKDILKKPYRRGKYLLLPTFKNKILLIHLGMSGQIKIRDNKYVKSKHDHITSLLKQKIN